MGLLEKGTTAILKVRSRVWAETFIEVCGRTLPYKLTRHTLYMNTSPLADKGMAEEKAVHYRLVFSHWCLAIFSCQALAGSMQSLFIKASKKKILDFKCMAGKDA